MCGWPCVCSGARWHVFGFGKLAYSHAQFSKWSERCFSLSLSLLCSFIPSDGPYKCIRFYPAQCCMHHLATERCVWSLNNVLLLFFSSQQHISTAESALLRARGATRDGDDGRYTERTRWDASCREDEGIRFSFLRPSHSLVLWHYVFRRGHCSCLHGKAEDVGVCTCFLFQMMMHSPLPCTHYKHVLPVCCTFSTWLRQSSRCNLPIRRRMLSDAPLECIDFILQPVLFAILLNCNVKARPVNEGPCHECC